jgi:lactoylglutathione lyase
VTNVMRLSPLNEIYIEHVAIWARDLERLRDFYVALLGGESGSLYVNHTTGFHSYFVSFGDGARLELMTRPPGKETVSSGDPAFGYAHVAFRLGSREAVDRLVGPAEALGASIPGRPRVTGDGYYEAVLADPEGNRVELVE